MPASKPAPGWRTGKIVEARDATRLLEAVIRPGDRVCLEGNNQKQADLLAARCSRSISPRCTTCTWCSRASRCRSISTCSSAASRRGSTSPTPARNRRASPRMLFGGKIELGAIHTYLELFAPLLHRPHAARRADRRGQRRPRRQPLHRPEHRGHAGHRRGDRVQGRHRDRPGQRDRRQGAARRHPGRLGPLRRQVGQAVLRRAAVHARSRRRSPRSRS